MKLFFQIFIRYVETLLGYKLIIFFSLYLTNCVFEKVAIFYSIKCSWNSTETHCQENLKFRDEIIRKLNDSVI